MDKFDDLVTNRAEFEERFATLYAEAVDLTDLAHRMSRDGHERFAGILHTLEFLRGEDDTNPLDSILTD